ncbi:MAG: HD domain-containing protein [Lentisphaeria bacterium]
MYSTLFPALKQYVYEILTAVPHCHGWDHTVRVWKNARHIARVEQADSAVVEYAALLHDIGRAAEFENPGNTCHAQIGATKIPSILTEIGISNPDFIEHVTQCVLTHRYRKRQQHTPQTLEAKIVFDADKLDSMGAIGLGRAFHFAGRIGAKVHNTAEAALASESHSPDDTAYREYLVKLRYIHENMLTEEGKKMAEARCHFMEEFFAELNRETQQTDF